MKGVEWEQDDERDLMIDSFIRLLDNLDAEEKYKRYIKKIVKIKL